MHVSLSVDSESAAVCTSAAKSRIHGELSIAALEALRHPKPGFAMAIDQQPPETSNVRLGRYGKSPAIPKCLGRNLDAGCGLLALIFAALDHADDAPHQGDVEPSFLGDSLRRMGILNVVIQNYVENFIGAGGNHYLSVRDAAQPMAASPGSPVE